MPEDMPNECGGHCAGLPVKRNDVLLDRKTTCGRHVEDDYIPHAAETLRVELTADDRRLTLPLMLLIYLEV